MNEIKVFFNLFLLLSPPPLPVNLIPLLLARPWMHAGSRDLLLYQHRARCTLGASCLPFISPGCRDVSLVCVGLLDTGEDHIFWVLDWAGADYVFCGYACTNVNMCVFVSWQSVCVSGGIRSQASPRGLGEPVTSKGHGARYASLAAKGEILFMWRGLAWQDQWLTPQPGARTDCHHPCSFKSRITLWCHNPASSLLRGKYVWIREDNISGRIQCFDLRPQPCEQREGTVDRVSFWMFYNKNIRYGINSCVWYNDCMIFCLVASCCFMLCLQNEKPTFTPSV